MDGFFVIFTDTTMSLHRNKIKIKPKTKATKTCKEWNRKKPSTIYLWLNHLPMGECNAIIWNKVNVHLTYASIVL